MLKRTYCLFDRKANIYMNPLTFLNDDEAMRWFTTIVNAEETTNVSLYPQDFILVYLGTFDDESGKYANELEELCTGTTVKQVRQEFTVKDIFQQLQDYLEGQRKN